MMRSSSSYYLIFFLLCFLATSLYLASPTNTNTTIIPSSTSALTFLPGMRAIKVSSSSQQHPPSQVTGETETFTNQAKFMEKEYRSINNDPEELAYHIDYHGVSTHPTPNPKHPTP
ncbi:hypothetical protein LguiA_029052 [Lonicera macranthoides]